MKKLKFGKIVLISILIIGIFVFGGMFKISSLFQKDVAEAKSVSEVLNIMGKNSPINLALEEEIESVKAKAAEVALKLERERLVELARLAELDRKKEEDKKATNGGKMAYLTFDDGPSAVSTYAVLDILAEYDIKATFFVVGKMVGKYPEVLLRTAEEGHSIGNHSYSHDYGYLYHSTKNFMRDIDLADKALKEVLGQEYNSKIMRFPGGSFGEQKAPMRKSITAAGYEYYDWNALNGDAEGTLMPKKFLIDRLKSTARNQKKIIILMHDTDVKTTTVEALRDIIEYLIDEGYDFGVLDENYKK